MNPQVIPVHLRLDTTPMQEALERARPLLQGLSERFGNVIAEGFADLIHKGIEARLVECGGAAGADSDYVCTVVVSIPWFDEIFPAVRAGNVDGC